MGKRGETKYPTQPGDRPFRLTAFGEFMTDKSRTYLLAQCDCGKVVTVHPSKFWLGTTKSCGCLKAETIKAVPKKAKQHNLAEREVYLRYKRRGRSGGKGFSLTFESFLELTQQECAYCLKPPFRIKTHRDGDTFIYNGVDRIDSSRGYHLGNVQPCCRPCNVMKSDLTEDQFREHILRLAELFLEQDRSRKNTSEGD